jgi:hypothetical protein
MSKKQEQLVEPTNEQAELDALMEGAPEPEPSIASEEPPAEVSEWRDMSEALRDGTVILLTPDGEHGFEAKWHITRRFDSQVCKWIETWSWVFARSFGVQRISFVPIGWKPAS